MYNWGFVQRIDLDFEQKCVLTLNRAVIQMLSETDTYDTVISNRL